MKKLLSILLVLLLLIGIVRFLESKKIITVTFARPKIEDIKVGDTSTQDKPAQVYFLDVGQGDATLVVFPNGEELLVDCARDAVVLSALSRVRHWNDRTLDYLIVTHPDSDHYAGCIDVLSRYTVKKIFLTGYEKNSGPLWTSFMNKVHEAEASGSVVEKITTAQNFVIAGVTTTILYPDHDVARDPRIPKTNVVESNDTSMVVKLSAGTNDILLTGDTEAPLENYLVSKLGGGLEAELLKVGHHGSLTSSSDLFLNAVAPKYCLISVGKDNAYGHPAPRVLKRLERHNCQVLRTDQQGDILFSLSPSQLQYETP